MKTVPLPREPIIWNRIISSIWQHNLNGIFYVFRKATWINTILFTDRNLNSKTDFGSNVDTNDVSVKKTQILYIFIYKL